MHFPDMYSFKLEILLYFIIVIYFKYKRKFKFKKKQINTFDLLTISELIRTSHFIRFITVLCRTFYKHYYFC